METGLRPFSISAGAETSRAVPADHNGQYRSANAGRSKQRPCEQRMKMAAPQVIPAFCMRAMLWRMPATDADWMREALAEAREAERSGEVPVGAVLVRGEECLTRSGNRTITDCDPTAHAEMVALRAAARAVGNYRLEGATLYVTLEPCAMCAGAIVQARLARVVYGADDPKGGAFRSCFALLTSPKLNHRVEVTPGVLAGDCAVLLQSFFAARR